MPRAQGGQRSRHTLAQEDEFGMPMATGSTPIFMAWFEPQEVAPVLNLAQRGRSTCSLLPGLCHMRPWFSLGETCTGFIKFSTLDIWVRQSLFWWRKGSSFAPCRMFSSVPHLYSLDAGRTPPPHTHTHTHTHTHKVTIQMFPDIIKCLPGEKLPQDQNAHPGGR